ncbi:MFS transporter [Intrasporangium sp.]|uniref:MFS transporter n=1 Tax=Intrasporangium sp. TaxID=1925024 RepID=UPI003221CCCD
MSTTAGSDPPPTTQAEAGSTGLGRAVVAAVVGTVIEWYDYALYGAAAGVVIGPLFFPDVVSSAAALAAFATFAVGFVVRPLGGVVIGHIGDRFGRKPAMILSIVLMGGATVAIGLLPTASTIGVWAAILLVLFRCVQGFGAGAELAGAMTLVAEYAPPARRGFFTSLVLSAPPAGIVLATGAFFAAASLPEGALLSWAWRLPFLVSAALFLVALYIRNRLNETPEYRRAAERAAERAEREKLPLVELFRTSSRHVLLGFLSITGHNALNYIMAAFAIAFMTSDSVGMSRPAALLAVTIGSIFGVVTTPLGGMASDRFGAGRVLAAGSLAGAVFAYPLFMALRSGSVVNATIAIAIGYAAVIACTSGSQGAFLVELFPTKARFSGIAVARELNGALVAGLTPLIALALIQAAGGQIYLAAGYLAVCCLLSAGAVLTAQRWGAAPAAEVAQ